MLKNISSVLFRFFILIIVCYSISSAYAAPVTVAEFLKASGNGDFETVRQALRAGMWPDAVSAADSSDSSDSSDSLWRKHDTALMKAIRGRHIRIVRLLVFAGANVNREPPEKHRREYRESRQKRARGYSSPVASPDIVYGPPLWWAVAGGDVRIVSFLIRRGARLEGRALDDSTALQKAVLWMRPEIVKILLDAGANQVVPGGPAALTLAMQTRDYNEPTDFIARELIARGADVSVHDNEPLRQAVRNGHLDGVRLLFSKGARPGQSDIIFYYDSGAFKKSHEMLRLLIEGAADVNAYGRKRGVTRLMRDVYYKDIEAVTLLLAAGADVNLRDRRGGETALIIASRGWRGTTDKDFIRILKILLTRGADPNLAKDNGWTPLMIASWHGYEDVVKILLKAGAKPHTVNRFGDSAVSIAEWRGHHKLIKLFYANREGKNDVPGN